MRVLLTTWAWPSHLYAMVPLAWALRSAGHEVRVAAPPGLAGAVEGTGLPLAAVGHDVDAASAFRQFAGRARPAAPVPAVPPGPARPGAGVPRALGIFAEIADAMADDLVELARQWRPDLVVYEPTAWAGALAAAAAGVPAVRHAYGLDLLSRVPGPVADLLAPTCARHGLPPVDPAATVTVDPCPARLQLPTLSERLPMRYLPFNGPGAVPEPPLAPPRRPRVCVTWGTTMTRLHPSYLLVAPAVAALAGTGVEVVAAVTARQRPLLGAVPPGVRVVTDVPLHLVVAGCAAVVAHGGAGSLLTALAAGVPQVLVPQLPDHAAHARRLAELGAARVIGRDEELTAARLRAEVGEVVDGGGYRGKAGELAAEMAAQPAPARVVEKLVAHAGREVLAGVR